MKRLFVLVTAVVALLATSLPASAGLFGPSKKELMGRIIATQQAQIMQAQIIGAQAHEQRAIQTELLRQLVGQAAATHQAVERQSGALEEVKNRIVPSDLRSVPTIPGGIPSNILRDVQPAGSSTVSPDLKTGPGGGGGVPQNIFQSRGNTSFTKAVKPLPAGTVGVYRR